MLSDEYRSKAAGCLLIAKTTKAPETRARWLAMAQAWNRLADEADRKEMLAPFFARLDGNVERS